MKKRQLLDSFLRGCSRRPFHSSGHVQQHFAAGQMSGWCIKGNGGGMKRVDGLRLPVLDSLTSDVLVRVRAAGVNPLDVMTADRGYGRTFFRLFRQCFSVDGDHHAVIPGREFCGTAVDFAPGYGGQLRRGDEVFGAVFPGLNGAHAEYVSASNSLLRKKPSTLTTEEAASLPFAGMTAISALKVFAGMTPNLSGNDEKRVLVLGAAGGVGHLLVQVLKAWKHRVIAVCTRDCAEMMVNLGADEVHDYEAEDHWQRLCDIERVDVIVDCAGELDESRLKRYRGHLRPWRNAAFVTLSSPLIRRTDESGIPLGLLGSAFQLANSNLKTLAESGSAFKWAYFTPIPGYLQELASLAEEGKLRPLIQAEFPLSNLPQAYQEVKNGHIRGKIVLVNK